ncbi:MAG TPA: class I mannose-6-phosphate isomerase [Xanthobacteraceae bacterium]|jgi:mannose-6-phosphate isomerase|nr:class I mannose-6-phosphate isomerase [Xanthobacteraceae bacterium]
MTIERSVKEMKRKPWGSTHLLPWSRASTDDGAIGEVWFQRPAAAVPESALLLKLLFTTEPLSIQVHPDDAFAQAIGLPNGKSEAWYILSAVPNAQVAVGLKYPLSSTALRASIGDGSIVDMVQWRPVRTDDVIFVPAGTIHAIGPGIVLAEIQQRSDVTFRLFDYGRQRGLHADNAVAAAHATPAPLQPEPEKLTEARTALVVSPHFVLEKIDLSPHSNWAIEAKKETWILVLSGDAAIGLTRASLGDAIFLDTDRAGIEVGPNGMKALLVYLGPNLDTGRLEEQRGTSIDVASQASSCAPLPPIASGQLLLKRKEART